MMCMMSLILPPSKVGGYDVLVLGTSTWGDGDLEDDWFDFLAGLESLDLAGKKIALFGCGDETMDDTFCSGVGELYERLQPTGLHLSRHTILSGILLRIPRQNRMIRWKR